MHIPKRYGESRRDACPFCKKQATTANDDGFPVCVEHKTASVPEMKCVCGSTLDLKNGKFGAFFNCFNCGNVSSSKVFEMNDLTKLNVTINSIGKTATNNSATFSSDKKDRSDSFAQIPDKRQPKEVVVRADDPFYCS